MLLFAPVLAADPPPASRFALADALGADDASGFARALTPREFVFPRDHGPHPEFRNEWWYVTGNLDGPGGERFGFELTIFRVALAATAPASPSAWRTNQVYFAHFALTDAARGTFRFAERYSRGAAGLAGAEAEPFRAWLHDWSIADAGDGTWQLRATDADFGIELSLRPVKAPVANGRNGLSQKSPAPGNASYYYSMPRLHADGTVVSGSRTFAVAGLAWLDREWSTSALGAGQEGWDWFALQLDDGADLMFYLLRQQDGTAGALSAGTYVAADGRVTPLRREDVRIGITDTWQSPLGGTYPAGWTLAVPSLDLALEIEPVIANQELDTILRYWEGAVDVQRQPQGPRLRRAHRLRGRMMAAQRPSV